MKGFIEVLVEMEVPRVQCGDIDPFSLVFKGFIVILRHTDQS